MSPFPHRRPAPTGRHPFADITTVAICLFDAPFPLLGAGFFFSPRRRMLPVEYLPLGAILKATIQADRTRLAISALCALLIAGPILARALTGTGTLDSDVWFLLATGREIARNGIPYINPFSIWPGQGMVAQQWLHDVWLWAWYTSGGYTAVAVSACVPAGLLFWQLSRLMLDAADGKLSPAALAFCLAVPSVCICMYISVRPTIWTALLCALTARILLRYLKDGGRRALLRLPAIAVAGVNLQAAQWPLLAACAAAFALPYPHELANPAARRAWFARAMPICAAVAAMCAASPLNPYGADGSLYVLKSLGEASYGGAIVEMQPLWVPLGPLFAVPVAAMALGPIALCRRSGAKVPAGAVAMLLAGIAAGVLHSRCMWIAGLSCGLCCAFGLAGALGEPMAHPGRAAAAAGAAMALLAAVSGLAVSLAPRSGGEAGLLSVTESEMSPIFSAIYDAGPDALVFSSDVSVYNQLEWEGFKVPCDMRPEIWGERIAGAGSRSAYRGIVDVLQGSTSLKESTEDWGWELFLVRDDEADTLRSGGHFDELAHGGGYALFELSEGGE